MNFSIADEHTSADVLVIGGGAAGCFAAIKAAETGARVAIFEKAHILRSGSIATGINSIPLINPEYNLSFDEFAKFNVKAGGGIVDEDLSYELARDSLDRVLDLERYGVKIRDNDGSFVFTVRPDISPGKTAISAPGPRVWQDVKPQLAKKVLDYPNITVLNRTAAVGLLTEDGMIGSRVTGAVGLNTRTGKFIVCAARAVVLVSGDSDRLGRPHDTLYSPARFISVAPPTNCGDGQAMAYRAGADIVNMEFAYLSRMWKNFAHSGAGQVIATVGGRIITGRGKELAPADFYRLTCQGAFNTEAPIYLDVSGAKSLPDSKRAMQLVQWGMENGCTSAGNLLWINERGEDLIKTPIEVEWRPPAIHNNQAGVHIDIMARSTLEGLYCAGDVIGGGWRQATAGAFVFGARAGINAAEYARKAFSPKHNNEQVTAEKNRILEAAAINPRDGYSWIELEDKVRKIASDYGPPFTNDAKLERGLTRLEQIRSRYLPGLYAGTPRDMMRVSELKSIFFMVEAFLRSAAFRKESRQNACSILHKTDYPERDNENWLKHTLIQNKNGEMKLSTKEVRRLNKN